MTFCFINAASQYHSSPVKQRDVHKDSKGGIAHHGRFPPLPMKKRAIADPLKHLNGMILLVSHIFGTCHKSMLLPT